MESNREEDRMSAKVETWYNAFCPDCEWEGAPELDMLEAIDEAADHSCLPKLSDEESAVIRRFKRALR